MRFCPVCKKETEWVATKRKEQFDIRDEQIDVELEVLSCSNCQTEFEDLNSEHDPYAMAYEEYRNRKGMLHPSQIVEFRKKYKLTQKELGDLLGFGDVTLSRYENGALQDEAHDKLLRLNIEPRNLLSSIELKPEVIAEKKRELLVNSLKREVLLTRCFPFFDEDESSIYTGNRTLDLEKVINLIKFLTQSSGVFKTKLLKLLFYVDFKYFKEFNVSMTGMQYARLPLGPVPEDFNLLIGVVLETDSTIQLEERVIANREGEVLISSSPYDKSCFNESEVKIIQEINSKFLNFTSSEIKEYSHKEKAYIETKPSKLISYEYAKDLSI